MIKRTFIMGRKVALPDLPRPSAEFLAWQEAHPLFYWRLHGLWSREAIQRFAARRSLYSVTASYYSRRAEEIDEPYTLIDVDL